MKIIFPVVLSLALTLSASAQSILQSADNFTLLGGSTVTSSAGPTTVSNGNVGSQTSVVGFPPATITAGVRIDPGATVDAAITDLGIARTGLANMTAATNLAGLDLSGMTLLPGVYTFGAGGAQITLSGSRILTLDANFQNNAFWVFQIGTTLITADTAQVTFSNLGTNGGNDLGVFWNAGTGITIGANNLIAGNYLAGTNISIGANTGGSARALAAAGVTIDSTVINALGGPGGGDLTGGLTLGPGNSVIPSSIPEPAAILWLAPLGALGLVLWRRSLRAKQVS